MASALHEQSTYDTSAAAGETGSVDLSLTAPSLPGLLDIVLVLDQSGSYRDDLPQLRLRLPELVQSSLALQSDLRFGIAGFNSDPTSYQLHLPMANDSEEVRDVLRQMTASGGATELWIHALDRVLDDFEFRSDALAIVLLATDEPSGQLGTLDIHTVSARYVERGIRVVGLVPSNIELSQVQLITAQTGGTVENVASDSSDVERAILRGLENLPVDIVPAVDPACPMTESRFDPAELRGVAPGADVRIRLDYRVDDAATSGNATCTVTSGMGATTSFILQVSAP